MYQLVGPTGQLTELTPQVLFDLLGQLQTSRVLTQADLPSVAPAAPQPTRWADLQLPEAIARLAQLTPAQLTGLLAPPAPLTRADIGTTVQPYSSVARPCLQPPIRAVSTTAIQALEGFQTVDGVESIEGDPVLLTGQPNGRQNGPWIVHQGAWTRPTWWTQAYRNDWFQVLLGINNAASVWVVDNPGTVRVDADPLVLARSV